MVKKADVILLISAVLLGTALFFAMLFIPRETGDILVITIDNQEYMRVSLKEDTVIELPHNTVVIENSKAYVSSSHCPDKVCINQGKIGKKGQTIICLPAKLSLEVE
ncbi:MAG: NusG domain II-containing protein [Acutalibacteraceae bacterium]|nr:NusG domain II-containing protein [Acutalibacteraceae bacterium]